MNHDLDFKYCTSIAADHLWTFGLFAVCFGVLLIAMRLGGWVVGHWAEAVSVFVGLMVLCVYEGALAARIAGRFTEKSGTARFGESDVEIVLEKRTERIRYNEVAAVEYEKVVGSTTLWDFLPTAKLTVRLTEGLGGKPTERRRPVICSSRAEARKMKKEHGISSWKTKMWNRDGSSVVVPETSLWPVCVELSRRTGLNVQVNEKIEDTSLGV